MLDFKQFSKAFSIDGLYSAFEFDWDDKFVFSGESHDFWEIVFVESGEVEVTEDENVYILGAGNMIFHAPMEFHRIKSSGGSSPDGFILSFGASGSLPETISSGIFSLDPAQVTEYTLIRQKALDFYAHPEYVLLGHEVSALLTAFIIRLGSKNAISGLSMSQSAIEYRKIVSYMFNNVQRNLTLSDIAAANNISVSYVKLLFSIYAGISPKAYYNQLRVRYATELLQSGISVTEVSDKMNFSSPNYFSTFYKKLTGVSPSDQQRGV